MGRKIWLFIAAFLLLSGVIYVPPSGIPIRLMTWHVFAGIYSALRRGARSLREWIKKEYRRCRLCKWHQIRRYLIILLACPFMVAGIIGVILSLVPGWPFLLIGFSLLAGEITYVARLRDKYKAILEHRAPRLSAMIVWTTEHSYRLWVFCCDVIGKTLRLRRR